MNITQTTDLDEARPVFEMVPTIMGVPASNLSDDDILRIVLRLDAQNKAYEQHAVETQFINARIKQASKDMQLLVQYLNK